MDNSKRPRIYGSLVKCELVFSTREEMTFHYRTIYYKFLPML